MAEKATGKGGDKATKKQTRDKPGKGHNIEAIGADLEKIADAYLAKKKAMDADMAGYRSEINDIYEKAADKLGVKKSVIAAELKRIEKNKKQEEKEQEMAADEREQTELLRASLSSIGGDLFRWGAGKLAKPAARAALDEK